MINKLSGASLAGTSLVRDRVDNDYYATPIQSTIDLLKVEDIIYPAFEPACGEGHISKLLDTSQTLSTDLINRGYGDGLLDYLSNTDDVLNYIKSHNKCKNGINTIITNPPFNLFLEFLQQSLKLTNHKVILFGKLQALEGQVRASFIEKSPLETVYVFKKRQNPLRNGSEVDENGKPWASTMAFAWYVWNINYTGNPIIKWL